MPTTKQIKGRFCKKMDDWLRFNGLTQSEFARRFGISQPYFNGIILGRRLCGTETAKLIEKVTNGQVKKSDLRPDIWEE